MAGCKLFLLNCYTIVCHASYTKSKKAIRKTTLATKKGVGIHKFIFNICLNTRGLCERMNAFNCNMFLTAELILYDGYIDGV